MLQDPSVAFPLASVVRSVPVRSSPRVSASNVTDTPARPLPKASVTFATGRIPTAWPTTTYWNASLTAVTAAAAPALAVAKVTDAFGNGLAGVSVTFEALT